MATVYKYSILVTFVHPNPNLARSREQVSYSPQPAHIDEFRFNNRSVRILANRGIRIPDTQQDLYGKPNSINNQIHKAIEYYYITCPQLTKVSSIQIICRTKTTSYSYINANTYQQPLAYKRGLLNSWMLTPAVVHDMLQYGGNGPTYRIALSYCLKSTTENTDFAIFSNLWRAFNALYRYSAHSARDASGLRKIESIIRRNYLSFASCRPQLPIWATSLSSLRWERYILNKVSFDKAQTPNHGTGTSSFLQYYYDSRINTLFRNITQHNIGMWSKILTIQGIIPNDIIQHFRTNIRAHRQIQREVLILLVKDYAYFLRNTLFHGVVDEPSFSLGETQEQRELGMAKTWLECIIKDLLKNHLI